MEQEHDIQAVTHGDTEIRIIRSKCISASTCVVYAPRTFDLDDGSIAVIKDEQWDELEKIVSAAQSCPVLAIEVYRDGKKLFPTQN